MVTKRKEIPEFIVWNRVKALREEKKLSQARVANDSGVSVPTLWMIESGFCEKTTQETKQKLATYFKCEISDLFPSQMIGDKTFEQHLKESQTQKE